MCSTDAQLYQMSKYEQTYGIFDHANDKDEYSLKLVELHDGERIFDTNSPFADRMRTYIRLRINENFHMSFLEYVSLPRHIQELLTSELEKHLLKEKADEERRTAQVTNNLNRM